MAAGAVVHANESIHAGIECLFCVRAIGHVVVDGDPGSTRTLHHPVGLAQCRDQKRHTLLQGNVEPFICPLQVFLRTLLNDQVHADGLVGERADVLQALAKAIAVHVGQAQWLHNADAAGRRHCCHQFRI